MPCASCTVSTLAATAGIGMQSGSGSTDMRGGVCACHTGKLLAFSGPSVAPFVMGSYVTHTPEDYHRYFHHKGVRAIVRLNNQVPHGPLAALSCPPFKQTHSQGRRHYLRNCCC